jgi:hypothetical protein
VVRADDEAAVRRHEDDWLTATIQTSLHTATYTPNQDTDDFFNDATNEVTGTNYTANGVTLGSKTNTYDATTDEIRLDAADAVWTTATIASHPVRGRVGEHRGRVDDGPAARVLTTWGRSR